MASFFARRYVRPLDAVGSTEKLLGVLVLVLVLGIIVVFLTQVASDREYLFSVHDGTLPERNNAEENPFPDIGIADWRRPERAERFSPDDLHVKIDGRAEAYRELQVAGLVFGSYFHAGEPDRTLDVYWYDLGRPANARAAYESERPPKVSPVNVGEEGYQVGGGVFFWSGASYVQVLPSRPGPVDAQAALQLARRLAERISR